MSFERIIFYLNPLNGHYLYLSKTNAKRIFKKHPFKGPKLVKIPTFNANFLGLLPFQKIVVCKISQNVQWCTNASGRFWKVSKINKKIIIKIPGLVLLLPDLEA